MTLLAQLAEAVAAGTIEVVDLTAPLSHETPIPHRRPGALDHGS